MTNGQTNPDQIDAARGIKIRSRYIALAAGTATLGLPPAPVWKPQDYTTGILAAKFMIAVTVIGVTAWVGRKAKSKIVHRYRLRARDEKGFFAQVDLPIAIARRADRLKIIPALFAAAATYALTYVAMTSISAVLNPPAMTQPQLPGFQPQRFPR